MLIGSGLVVPVILWGKRAPAHTVTTVALSLDQKLLFTGSAEGQICAWDGDFNSQMTPKMLLYGHTGSISCVTAAGPNRLASADDNGGLCLWDTLDYQCLASGESSQIHTAMKAHKFEEKDFYTLLCNGHYPEINILNADNLQVIYSLVARVHPDWINAFCLLTPKKQQDNIILAVTNSGTIKMWTLNTQTVRSSHVYEDESKQIRCIDAKVIQSCIYNQRTLLIVCAKNWQIYDAGEFSLLCSEVPSSNTQWVGGQFISIDTVMIWSCSGHAYLYRLPPNSNPDHMEYHQLVGTRALQHASPILCHVIEPNPTVIASSPSVFLCERLNSAVNYLLLRVDADSSIHNWNINREGPVGSISKLDESGVHSRPFRSLWEEVNPAGLLDHVLESHLGESDNEYVTCSLYIASSGRLLSGLSNGDIVIIPILHTIRNVLFSALDGTKGNQPIYRTLRGHKARVNSLLYPHSVSSRYNSNHLLSGGSDFSVCLWDLSQGHLVHVFAVHAGQVMNFYIPPPNCNNRVLSCVCSVANDHSVALLSLKEKRPLVFASRHMFPVMDIKWKPVEDFMVISCSDSTAYVWQMETGLLDRVVHGVTAVEILKACDNTNLKISSAGSHTGTPFFTLGEIEIEDELDNTLYSQHDVSTSLGKHTLYVYSLNNNYHQAQAHVILFDAEALIMQLLWGEFGPGTVQEPGKVSTAQRRSGSKIFSDGSFLQRLNSGGDLEVNTTSLQYLTSPPGDRKLVRSESFLLETAQIIISLIHAWNLDKDLDILCVKKLGLHRLHKAVSFGLLSGHGYAAFMLPQMYPENSCKDAHKASMKYWEICGSLTTQNLLTIISLANTLMSMANITFLQEQGDKSALASDVKTSQMSKQSQTKHSWSLLAALHCILLPDLVDTSFYNGPTLHHLANRWQDRCLEVREAAQALLLAEMRRIGKSGRKQLITYWTQFMPNILEDGNGTVSLAAAELDLSAVNEDEPQLRKIKSEQRNMEGTSIVMFGVIGAEFSSDIEFDDVTLAWHTSKALSHLLLNQLDGSLSANVPLRRAAIDLLGRGFSVWQPYVDASAILLGLLEISYDADRILPSDNSSSLPLSATADACRSARRALSLIATAQPATFLTCMAKEVTRYNAAAQSAQSSNQLHNSVIVRAKSEILHVIENLIDKMPNSVADLLLETMDVAVHCLDASVVKSQGLHVAFPALCKFPMVSYCTHSRRICVGSKNGNLAFYEIKQSKAQTIPFQASPTAAMIFYLKPSSKELIQAHHGAVAAVAFSDDGKYLASFSPNDLKVNLWHTSASSIFGSQHTKCIKTYTVPWKSPGSEKINNVTKAGRITWFDNRTAALLLPDGTESRYKL